MSDNTQKVSAFNHESLAVHEHLKMYQGIITRMSKNSVSSKQWCVVLVSAIFALVAEDSLAWGYYKLKECKKADEILSKLKDKEQDEIKEHIKKVKECLKR